jgi:hypothetical protein
MLSCQYEQNTIDGKKQIILNPAEQQRRDVATVNFAENEIYGIDILVVSSADGKVKLSVHIHWKVHLTNWIQRNKSRSEDSRSTVYQKASEVNYQLKMKTSRAVFSEAQKKSGAFPFNIRCLDDEKRARMGLQEAVQHGLVREYPILWVLSVIYDIISHADRYTAPGSYVAAFHFTIALLSGGPSLITHPPVWYSPEKVKTEKEVEDEELKELLERPLREKKNKKNKKKAEEEEEEWEGDIVSNQIWRSGLIADAIQQSDHTVLSFKSVKTWHPLHLLQIPLVSVWQAPRSREKHSASTVRV